MAVAFGFSFGDFVAGIHVILICIRAVNDTRGVSAEFQALIGELETLEASLAVISGLQLSAELSARKIAIDRAVQRCQQCINSFVLSVAKYQPWLQPRLRGWQTNVRKIKWALCKREDVVEFRRQLTRHTSAINTMLLTLQLHQGAAISSAQNRSQRTAETTLTVVQNVQANTASISTILNTIESSQRAEFSGFRDRAQKALKSTLTVAQNVQVNTMSLNELVTKLSIEQRNSFRQLLQQSQVQAQALHQLQNVEQLSEEIPAQVLLQRPVILYDVSGNRALFHLDFINSKEAFVAVMKARLETDGSNQETLRECCINKIETFNFVIANRKRIYDFAEPWESIFQPGQVCYMGIRGILDASLIRIRRLHYFDENDHFKIIVNKR